MRFLFLQRHWKILAHKNYCQNNPFGSENRRVHVFVHSHPLGQYCFSIDNLVDRLRLLGTRLREFCGQSLGKYSHLYKMPASSGNRMAGRPSSIPRQNP